MVESRIINKDTCAVSFNPTEILLRKRGKEYYGKEKSLVLIKDGKLYIRMDVAKEFGIEVVKE